MIKNLNIFGRKKLIKFYKIIIYNWKKYKLFTENRIKHKFIIHDGPPYANGYFHVGHIINKIYKDIIIKFKFLCNYNSILILGWDCNGYTIESKINNNTLFLKKYQFLNNYVKKNILNQKFVINKLGLFVFNKFYYTNSNIFIKEELNILNNFFKKRLIYKKKNIIYNCFLCDNSNKSSIFYKFKNNISCYLYFNFLKNKFFKKFILGGIIIWTTNINSLLTNQGLSISKEFIYAIINSIKGIFILKYNKISNFYKFYKNLYIMNFHIGLNLINFSFLNPLFFINKFYRRNSNIKNNNHILGDIGTGIVHISPAYGLNDKNLYTKFNKLKKNILDFFSNKGIIYNNINYFKNLKFEDLKSYLIKIFFNNKNFIFKKYNHRYMYCWKHKIPIIYKLSNQWYIKLNFKKNLINKIKKKKINLINYINLRKKWNLNRKIYVGCPFPIIKHKKFDIIFFNLKFIKFLSEYISIYNSKILYKIKFNNIIINFFFYKKLLNVLDVWYDSGSTNFIILKTLFKKFLKFPADIYIEGLDQNRGWFQSSLLISYILNKKLPYKKLINHGFVINKKNEKLSKSLNNYKLYNKIFNKINFNLLRIWISKINIKKNIELNENKFKNIDKLYSKILNSITFIINNISDINYKYNINKINILNVSFINYLIKIYKFLLKFYNKIKLNKIIYILNKVLIKNLNFYFTILKDDLYLKIFNSKKRKLIQKLLYFILKKILIIIYPIISIKSEELWNELFIKKSILKKKYIYYKYNKIKIYIWFFFKKLYKLYNYKIEILKKKKLISNYFDLKLLIILNKNYFNFFFKKNINIFLNFKNKMIFKNNNFNIIFIIIDKYKCLRCWYKKILIKQFCKNCFIINKIF